jgi:hypothetical protein
MDRFKRDDEVEAARLPTPLGTATEDLRSTVESEVAKIIERAQARASEIEDQALEKANRIDQSSDRRAREVLEDSRQRIALMLAEVDAIERSVGEAVSSLRAETERLTGRIERAKSEPLLTPEPPAAAPEVEAELTGEPGSQNGDADAPRVTQPESEMPMLVSAPEIREMIRQQLLSLAEAGRTRADAQRMLLRFKEGEQFFDLLDEIYPEETPSRRGLLRRRKAPSQES